MSADQKGFRSAVHRNHAEDYLLMSLIAFGVTVVAVRVFLQLTGFPQIGNSVLHIAHALWGALLLFIAVLLPLLLANRWAIQISALLSGVGIGLFIDEVGKFITQTNDYFFPPALSLIYGFFLLTVLLYLYFRRSRHDNPRAAMYHVLEGLQDALDGDLDTEEAARIEKQLAKAAQSERDEIVLLAYSIGSYMEREKEHLLLAEPGLWKRSTSRVDELGRRLKRSLHRNLISAILILWLIQVIVYIVLLIVANPSLDDQIIQWREALIIIQAVIGVILLVALISWLREDEERGLKFAVFAFVISLVALQSLYFFLSQFQAITNTLLQFLILLFLLAYRRWYLGG
jgi:hypothetical protein